MVLVCHLLKIFKILFCYRIVYCYHDDTNYKEHDGVAVTVQGTSKELKSWIEKFESSHLYKKNKSHLFLHTFDSPIKHSSCINSHLVTCLFNPNSTNYANGRNNLIRSVYSFEKYRKSSFKYWSFYDGDVLRGSRCHSSFTVCNGEFWCCLDIFHEWLLQRQIQYAVINNYIFHKEYEIVRKRTESYPLNKLLSTVYHMECNDADMSTFHRHAIPALLPYIELLVHMSWIYPNRMLWNLICGCVPTYSVIMVMFSAFSNTHSGNHPYNQPNLTLTKETMTKLFTKFKVSPTPVLTDRTYWLGSCNEKNFSLVEESDILSSNHSHLWRISERFKMCYERMSPRFHKYVTGESSLEEIDKIN